MAKESDLLLAKLKKKMKRTNKKQNSEKPTSLDGMMTLTKNDDGLHLMDFLCTEDAEIEAFTANCRVQAMHNGDVYITEMKKRVRNTPLFREDNSSLTLGRDGRYYFVFTMSKKQVVELPEQLVMQSVAIAKKVVDRLNGRKEVRK